MKAVAALRVSTREQGDSGLGLEAQERAVRALAERLGAELVGIHRDVGVSGAAGLQHRPGLLAAVGALGKGDVLIVAKRDRLGRDPVNVAMIERLVERKGARVVSAAGEGTDDDSPTSVLMRRIVDAFAEYERLLISARTRAALKSKRERGERAGEVPFGWRALPSGKLFEDEGERAAIRLVVDARARTLSARDRGPPRGGGCQRPHGQASAPQPGPADPGAR
ncbi:MAG: recombinase family protein [Planctomycetes bacterium]|nr:recombinase family protein [Planctomycetota bacterium]